MNQTGATELLRQQFVQRSYNWAKALLIHDWTPAEELEVAF